MSCGDVFLGLIAILFPPIAVWIKTGLCSADSLINILLCMLGYLPGLLHAWYIIAKNPEYDYEPINDSEANTHGGRVTYYYVSQDSTSQRQGQGQQQQPQTYGTNAPATNAGSKPARSNNSRPARASTQSGPSANTGTNEAGEPPSYADAVGGDHKIQDRRSE